MQLKVNNVLLVSTVSLLAKYTFRVGSNHLKLPIMFNQFKLACGDKSLPHPTLILHVEIIHNLNLLL